MTGGSDDARPPKDGPTAIDDAWDALIAESGEEESGDALPSASQSHSALGAERLEHPDEEMASLMGEGPSPTKPESTPFLKFRPPSTGKAKVEPPEVDAKPEPETKANEPEPEPKLEPETKADEEPEAGPETAEAEPNRPALRLVSSSDSEETRETEDDRPARAARPVEPPAPSEPPPSEAGLPWGWIGGGVMATGALVYFLGLGGNSTPSDAKQRPTAMAKASEPSSKSDPGGGSSDAAVEPTPSTDPVTPSPDVGTTTPTKDPEPKVPVTRSGDPREPPPGTPPEIAAVFKKLPVSPSDGPPIGGIGANGIHIDELSMGSEFQGSSCSGRSDDFSVSQREKAGVCVRVVHPREKDELQVLWQKHGGSTRRSKMAVLPKHAYRTRGYLKLRKEYIGDWTVRILSSDGVELARHDFTVVP